MTFRVTDQLSGRMMGIRADITPQTARMDAHSLRREGPSRLCYAGTVLHTRPRGPLQSRTPISIGVELFGETSLSADIEVIDLFLQTLNTSGVEHVYLDLGHVDICRGLLSEAGLNAELEDQLFELLQRKAQAELSDWIAVNIQDTSLSGWLNALPTLTGGIEVLTKAKELLKGSPEAVLDAIDQLEGIVSSIADKSASVYIDLGEIPGYHYHTGIVFAAYVQGFGKALGNGGRYDHVGEAFGRSRPATGFAIDLKSLVSQGKSEVSSSGGIFAPYSTDRESQYQVDSLRGQGKRVVQGFEGQRIDLEELKCDHQLVEIDGKYVVQHLS
jgi:ATP phosphoribosyltransferase regulatory subunit